MENAYENNFDEPMKMLSDGIILEITKNEIEKIFKMQMYELMQPDTPATPFIQINQKKLIKTYQR